MDKITYIPIGEESDSLITKADLYILYKKLKSLYEPEKAPENIIQLDK